MGIWQVIAVGVTILLGLAGIVVALIEALIEPPRLVMIVAGTLMAGVAGIVASVAGKILH